MHKDASSIRFRQFRRFKGQKFYIGKKKYSVVGWAYFIFSLYKSVEAENV